MLSDVRFALRLLLRQKLAASLVVAMLALGMAANVAVFSLVNGLFLRPLPFPEPERLVDFNETAPKWNLEVVGINYPDFHQWHEETRLFEALAAYDPASFNVASLNLASNASAERIHGARVTADMARVLRVEPVLGRMFSPEEDQPPSGANVVVIGHGLWQERFGARPDVIGETLRLDGMARTVIGVLPPAAGFPGDVRLWVPLGGDPAQEGGSYGLSGIGRLKAGVTVEEAEQDLLRAHQPIWEERDQERIVSPYVKPLRDVFVSDFSRIASTLAGAVVVLLLVACANVASVMLARSIARRREMAIRHALGAGRALILRQLFAEHLLLAAAGALAGLFLGQWALALLLRAVPDQLPGWASFDIDGRVVGFSLIGVVATTLLFGWAPALQTLGGGLRDAARGSKGGTTTSPRGKRTLGFLVALEFALAALLLVCGALLFRAFEQVRRVDPGFRSDHVLAFQLALPEAAYPDSAARIAVWDRLIERLAALPGVEAAGLVTCAPLDCHWGTFFEIEGQPRGPDESVPVTLYRYATAGYLRAMGLRLQEGRFLEPADGAPERSPVVVVNETFARTFWSDGKSPIGRRFKFNDDEAPWMTVVGLVHDVKHYGLELPMRPGIYLPLGRGDASVPAAMTVALRSSVEPESLVPAARRAVNELDAELPLFDVRTMEEAVRRSTAVRAAYSWLLAVFSLLAVALALGGAYGVAAYLASQRTREIGIRVALGARTGWVVRSAVGRGVALAALGAASGLGVSFVVTRFMAELLFGVDAGDAAILGAVGGLLVGAATLANWIPARKAALVDPMQSLRSE